MGRLKTAGLVLVVAVVLYYAAIGAADLGLVPASAEDFPTVEDVTDAAANAGNGDGGGGGGSATATGPYPPDRLEEEFVRLLNAERAQRDLSTLSTRPALRQMGDAHAENMASEGYIGHTRPDGTDQTDRYDTRGLLPECKLTTETGQVYRGLEVVDLLQLDTLRDEEYGPAYVEDAETAAEALLANWLQDEDIREKLFVTPADEIGLGMYRSGDRLFVAVEFC